MTRYRTIVIDPPWDHSDGTGVHVDTGKVTGLPYPTMTLDAIGALPVRDLSDNLNGDAHLYLWTTSRYLPHAFGLARGWGFHYGATLVWCKPSRGFSVGGAFQNNVEFVLFCRRPAYTDRHGSLRVTNWLRERVKRAGLTHKELMARGSYTRGQLVHWLAGTQAIGSGVPSCEQWGQLKTILNFGDEMDGLVAEINAAKGQRTAPVIEQATTRWFTWSRGAHSAKPEAFLDIVEQVSPGPYLEMFARRDRLGWDTWGNESLGTAEVAA